MTRKLHRFDPDWVVAPAEMLQEWMDENGVTVSELAVRCGPKELRDIYEKRLTDILQKRPFARQTPKFLQRATGIPAFFWLTFEGIYRAGLARGKRDTS